MFPYDYINLILLWESICLFVNKFVCMIFYWVSLSTSLFTWSSTGLVCQQVCLHDLLLGLFVNKFIYMIWHWLCLSTSLFTWSGTGSVCQTSILDDLVLVLVCQQVCLHDLLLGLFVNKSVYMIFYWVSFVPFWMMFLV